MDKIDTVNCDKVLQQLQSVQQCEKKWTTVPNEQKERTYELLYFYGLIKDIKNDQDKEIIALTRNGGRAMNDFNRSIETYLDSEEKRLKLDTPIKTSRLEKFNVFSTLILATITILLTIYSINQNKEKEELKDEINELKKKISISRVSPIEIEY